MNKNKALLPEAILILGKKKGILRILAEKRIHRCGARQTTAETTTKEGQRLIIRVLRYQFWSNMRVSVSPIEKEEKFLFSMMSYQVKGKKDQIRIDPAKDFHHASNSIDAVMGARKHLNELSPKSMKIPTILIPRSSSSVCY